jgi:hypothetical protein
MQPTNPSIAEDAKLSGDNLSIQDFIQQSLEVEESDSSEEIIADVEEEVPTEEFEETEEEFSEEEEVSEVEDVEDEGEELPPSEVDLLDLTPEQIQELVSKHKSRLLRRVGELSAKNKLLEEKAAQLEVQRPKVEVAQDQNPFANLSTIEEVKQKYKELEATLETTDSILEDHEDYGSEDLIEVGDKEFTKKQIRIANRNAREALNKFLPAQQHHLAKIEHLKTVAVQYQEAVSKEVPEVMDEQSEIGRHYKSMLADPLISKVKETIPELGVQVEYLLAHALRSITRQNTKVNAGVGNKLKVAPPASPIGTGSAKSKQSVMSRVQKAYEAYEETGKMEDWVRAATLERELLNNS